MREIISNAKVNLAMDEKNQHYVISSESMRPYVVSEESRTWTVLHILDIRCQSLERKCQIINGQNHLLSTKIEMIQSSWIYKIFHKLGLI